MMIDFSPLQDKGFGALDEIANGLSLAELRDGTAALYTQIDGVVAACRDQDVAFVADDPGATGDEGGWSLGHVIVHLTASLEEAATLAAEQARGVPFHGRSRYETPWERITSGAQLRQRLAESRRMCLAALEMWPDAPDLTTRVEAWPSGPVVDARGRYLLGLAHASGHLAQITEVLRQAQAA